MTIKIIKPVIEAGEPAFLASINNERPEIYSKRTIDAALDELTVNVFGGM